MADIVAPDVRSRMMSGIRGRNTKPELALRSALHRRGFRFRLHGSNLPGKPDMVFPKYGAVIFVHGCFWHGHGCHLFKWPKSRSAFWREKISANMNRDQKQLSELTSRGWRVATVWECAIRGRLRLPIDEVAGRCANWLRSVEPELDLRG